MKKALFTCGALAVMLLLAAAHQAPSIAASGLLHPARRPPRSETPPTCTDREFAGKGVSLRGWHCRAAGARRGTVVYLHGIADNRDSGVGVIRRFTTQGLDVIAYDSRAHGASDGDLCTYGYVEKDDLRRVIDTLAAGPVVLMGTSLGGAVALQEAATDHRVSAVIAAEVFSDLETIVRERAPAFVPETVLLEALRLVERRAGFPIGGVSPEAAARTIRAPVLLIHGEADTDTAPAHSRRVFAALEGSKRLILVPEARHNQSLSDSKVWQQIEAWVADALQRLQDSRLIAGPRSD